MMTPSRAVVEGDVKAHRRRESGVPVTVRRAGRRSEHVAYRCGPPTGVGDSCCARCCVHRSTPASSRWGPKGRKPGAAGGPSPGGYDAGREGRRRDPLDTRSCRRPRWPARHCPPHPWPGRYIVECWCAWTVTQPTRTPGTAPSTSPRPQGGKLDAGAPFAVLHHLVAEPAGHSPTRQRSSAPAESSRHPAARRNRRRCATSRIKLTARSRCRAGPRPHGGAQVRVDVAPGHPVPTGRTGSARPGAGHRYGGPLPPHTAVGASCRVIACRVDVRA